MIKQFAMILGPWQRSSVDLRYGHVAMRRKQ